MKTFRKISVSVKNITAANLLIVETTMSLYAKIKKHSCLGADIGVENRGIEECLEQNKQ